MRKIILESTEEDCSRWITSVLCDFHAANDAKEGAPATGSAGELPFQEASSPPRRRGRRYRQIPPAYRRGNRDWLLDGKSDRGVGFGGTRHPFQRWEKFIRGGDSNQGKREHQPDSIQAEDAKIETSGSTDAPGNRITPLLCCLNNLSIYTKKRPLFQLQPLVDAITAEVYNKYER